MRTLILPDIHNHTARAERVIANFSPDLVVLLGDYFDSFDDGPPEAERTAEWLAGSLQQPNRIHLLGNHDLPYVFPQNRHLYCPGWTPDKNAAVQKVIPPDRWGVLKLSHIIGKLVCSHAGLSHHVFGHPMRGVTAEGIAKTCAQALSAGRAGILHHATAWSPFQDDGRSGITWLRWWELEVIPEFSQAVGHTPGELRVERSETSCNVCFDTFGQWVGLIEDDLFYAVSTAGDPTVSLGSIGLTE
jgi:hypothetical protein